MINSVNKTPSAPPAPYDVECNLTTPLNNTQKPSSWSFNLPSFFNQKQNEPIAQEMHSPIEGIVYIDNNYIEAEPVNEPSRCTQECNRFTEIVSNYFSGCLKFFNSIIECPIFTCKYISKLYTQITNNPAHCCFLFSFFIMGPAMIIIFFGVGGYYIQNAKNNGARIRTYYYPCASDHTKTCHHSECYDASAKICNQYDVGESLIITASFITMLYFVIMCMFLKNTR